jgi:hypothetical protein
MAKLFFSCIRNACCTSCASRRIVGKTIIFTCILIYTGVIVAYLMSDRLVTLVFVGVYTAGCGPLFLI